MTENKKEGLLVLVYDYGRMHQRSFCSSEIFRHVRTKKYKKLRWVLVENEEQELKLKERASCLNFDTEVIGLYP